MQPRAIAIPIDDSPDSKFAVKFALKNVLREKDKVILLNVRRP